MNVAISLLTFNAAGFLDRNLGAVLATKGAADLLVSDSGSTDDTPARLAALGQLGAFRVQLYAQNVGYIAAHNAALAAHPACDVLVILNDDVLVGGGWLEALLAPLATDPQIAIVGPIGGCQSLRASGLGYCGATEDYVEGSCLALRAELARQHGLFDPAFRWGYSEDADFSLRLRGLGYRIAHVPVPWQHTRDPRTPSPATADREGLALYNAMLLRARWADRLGRGVPADDGVHRQRFAETVRKRQEQSHALRQPARADAPSRPIKLGARLR